MSAYLQWMQIYGGGKTWQVAAMETEKEGLRDRKRRETLARITEKGIELFGANGYEATTLDAIADAAGISRRTFFHYFQSKEEILFSWQSGLVEAVRNAVLGQSTQQSPLDALQTALATLTASFDAEHAITIDRVLRSNQQLRTSNQAKYLLVEQAAFQALCQLWPDATRRKGLRMVAMVCIGALRLAMDSWAEDGGRRPIAEYLKAEFASIKPEL